MSEERYLGLWSSRRDFLAGMAAVVAGIALIGFVLKVFGVDSLSPGLLFEAVESLDEDRCRDQLGAPLKASGVVAAFRAEAISMHSLPASQHCGGSEGAVAEVSNERGISEDEDVVAREGWATCFVYRTAYGPQPYKLEADLNRGPDSPIFAGTKALFHLANVSCSLYIPHYEDEAGEAQGEAQVGRALAAMKRLERKLRR